MNYPPIYYPRRYWTNFRITVVIILATISVLLFANPLVYAEGDTEVAIRDAPEPTSSTDHSSLSGHELSELESYTIVYGLDDEEFQDLIEPLGDIEWHKIELTLGQTESERALVIYAYRVVDPELPY